MSSYVIELDDSVIKAKIAEILNHEFNTEIYSRYSGAGREITAAVKDLIYDHKDEILEMVVDRAARELVKKGLPKLLERMDNA